MNHIRPISDLQSLAEANKSHWFLLQFVWEIEVTTIPGIVL